MLQDIGPKTWYVMVDMKRPGQTDGPGKGSGDLGLSMD